MALIITVTAADSLLKSLLLVSLMITTCVADAVLADMWIMIALERPISVYVTI